MFSTSSRPRGAPRPAASSSTRSPTAPTPTRPCSPASPTRPGARRSRAILRTSTPCTCPSPRSSSRRVLVVPEELQRPPTRSELNRELMLRAATSWDGLVALVVVAAAGVVLSLPVLIVVAVLLWLGASVWHYFDGSEADKLAADRARKRAQAEAATRLDPAALCEPVSVELRRARAQEASIRQTIMESSLPSDLTDG